MNIYVLSTGCYSDKSEIILLHEKKYPVEEFRQICNDMLKEGKEIFESDDFNNYWQVKEVCFKLAIEKYGFKTVSYLNGHLYDYENSSACVDVYECNGEIE